MLGDYFTSSDLHPIFARLVARQAVEMWEILERPSRFAWVEMGSGRGLFAVDFLQSARELCPAFYEALDYVAVEPGPKQRVNIVDRAARESLAARFRVQASLEEIEPVVGCFFSNELVDAFPVSVVTRAGGRLREVYITEDGDKFRERLGPISDSAVAAAVARYAGQLEHLTDRAERY